MGGRAQKHLPQNCEKTSKHSKYSSSRSSNRPPKYFLSLPLVFRFSDDGSIRYGVFRYRLLPTSRAPSLLFFSVLARAFSSPCLVLSAGGLRRHRPEDEIPFREQQAPRGTVRGPPGDRKDDEREDHRRQVCRTVRMRASAHGC